MARATQPRRPRPTHKRARAHPKAAARSLAEADLSVSDRELIRAARAIIRARYYPEKHHVGAALRTKSGKIYVGVHLETYVGRIAVCAEAVAVGAAATAGDLDIEAIVAARFTGEVVSPCGMCRELIADFAPEARVIIPDHERFRSMAVRELLPHKFRVLPVCELLPHKYKKKR